MPPHNIHSRLLSLHDSNMGLHRYSGLCCLTSFRYGGFLLVAGIMTISLIIVMLLRKEWAYKYAIAFGVLQILSQLSLFGASKTRLLGVLLGTVFGLAIIIWSLLDARKLRESRQPPSLGTLETLR